MKRLLLVALLLCTPCYAQERIASTTWVPKFPDTGIASGWHTLKAGRSFDDPRYGKTLQDIESHMPPAHGYRHADIGTWGHETTHGINSEVRQQLGARVNAFYCLDDWVCILREPRCTLADVAAAVPQPARGNQYELYLVTMQRPVMAGTEGWNDMPLYVLDEWVAYIHGAKVLQEAYGSAETTPDGRSIGHDVDSAVQFCGYAATLLEVVKQRDPQYADRAHLEKFIAYNVKRTAELTKLHPRPTSVGVFRTVFQSCPGGNCFGGGGQAYADIPWSSPTPATSHQPLATAPDHRLDTLIGHHNDAMQAIGKLQQQVAELVKRPTESGCKCGPPSKACACDLDGIEARLSAKLDAALAKLTVNQVKPPEAQPPRPAAEPVYYDIRPRK